MLTTLLLSILSNLVTILIPVSIGKYYDLVFEFNSHRSKVLDILPFDIGSSLQAFLAFFFFLVLVKSIFLFFEKYNQGIIAEQLAFDLRNELFNAQLNLPLPIYEEKGTGKYLLRFSGDMKSIQNYLKNGVIIFISDIILFVFTICVLVYFNLVLGLIVGAVVFVVSIIVFLLNGKLSLITEKRRNSKSHLLSFVNTRLRGIGSIRQFNKEKPETGKFLKISNKVLKAGIDYQKITAFIRTFVPASMYLLLAMVLALAYYLKNLNEQIEGSTILVFIMLLITILPIFRRLLKVNIVWELGNISFRKLIKVFNLADESRSKFPNLEVKAGAIEIQDVSFSFPNKSPLLKNVNFSFPANSICLVNGASGTGKGVLIKLLTGIYDLSEGSIEIDGQSINAVSPKSLRKNVAAVSSNIPLLGKTVFEAISYSRKSSKRMAAQKMLDHLQVYVPLKQRLCLDDRIGDLGMNLSLGQQKLLFYARALLTNKKILLIDEPSNDLDEATVLQVFTLLNELKKERTILLFSRKIDLMFINIDHYFQITDSSQFYSI